MNDIKQRVEETMKEVRKVYERTKSGLDKAAWDEFPKFSYVMYSKIGLLEDEIKDLTLREERLVELYCDAYIAANKLDYVKDRHIAKTRLMELMN